MIWFFVLPVLALVIGLAATFDMVKTKAKEIATSLAVLFILAGAAQAQAVSPVISECGKRCRGQFTVSNTGLEAFAAIVEPFSFSLDPVTGKSLLRPLDKTVELTLKENSARIPPHSEHTFDYEMRCSSYPCMVSMLTGMIVGHTAQGMAIRVIIPHVVYQCASGKDCRKHTKAAAGLIADCDIWLCLQCMGNCHEAADCKADCQAGVCKVDNLAARLR